MEHNPPTIEVSFSSQHQNKPSVGFFRTSICTQLFQCEVVSKSHITTVNLKIQSLNLKLIISESQDHHFTRNQPQCTAILRCFGSQQLRKKTRPPTSVLRSCPPNRTPNPRPTHLSVVEVVNRMPWSKPPWPSMVWVLGAQNVSRLHGRSCGHELCVVFS